MKTEPEITPMAGTARRLTTATCACGGVRLEAVGAPIVTAACYCASCREAGARFEAVAGAPPVREADGSTACLLFRKDRVRCVAGAERLSAHRLNPASKTRRVVATCCHAPIFLEFTGGHWLTLYRQRIAPAERPPIEMRVMTRDRAADAAPADGLPDHAGHSGRFLWRLLAAWIAMGFRSPRIAYVREENHAG